jgi:ketosteroid isomerase-like protein
MQPEDLGEFFLERANEGDVEGLVALYEPGAVLAFPPGRLATGHEEIRAVYAELLAGRPVFSSDGQQPVIRHGDLALTSTRAAGRRRDRRGSPPAAGWQLAVGDRSAGPAALTHAPGARALPVSSRDR